MYHVSAQGIDESHDKCILLLVVASCTSHWSVPLLAETYVLANRVCVTVRSSVCVLCNDNKGFPRRKILSGETISRRTH